MKEASQPGHLFIGLAGVALLAGGFGMGCGSVSGTSEASDTADAGVGGSFSYTADSGNLADPNGATPDEICGNGLDDNGDGLVDEDCPCDRGTTQPCFVGPLASAGVGICVYGSQLCGGDIEFPTWGQCEGYGVATEEIADNGMDDDCDGEIDEQPPVITDPPGDCDGAPCPTTCPADLVIWYDPTVILSPGRSCYANIDEGIDGQTTTVSAANDATTGYATYRCEAGTWKLSSGVCTAK